MMKYSELIKINQNFQSSINLELDLNNPSKIDEYIPTSDICDILKKYIKTFLNKDLERATLLEGPYGKGKSFLLLVLSYLVDKKEKDETYQNLLDKIKNVDLELYQLMSEFDKKSLSFLPVIINSTYDNLNQSFMLALNDALLRENITDIIPNTAYSICLDIMDKWENDNLFVDKAKKECLKKGASFEKIRRGLEVFDSSAYKQFESLYNCVTMGLEFNPLVNNDVVKIYSDIAHKLPEYGYSGMFVIFDEFSKFLESSGDDLTKHLKMIQDFAEKANRSDKSEQIDFCCVTHKSLALYSDKKKSDAFKTVEGRFKEIRFNRSLSENYQIISTAIHDINKNKIVDLVNDKKDFYDELTKSEIFKDVPDFNSLSIGCYPLNPVTIFALVHLSEIVAQNERTLFTFISDTDENSFNSFIQNENEGLFNVDKIYDYFSNLLKKEEENSIRNIWYRTEAVLSRLTDQIERKIIKTLAIILMINEPDIYSPSIESIHISLDIDKTIIEKCVKRLLENHYLRQNLINNSLSFASANSKEIDEQIEVLSKTKFRNISLGDILTEIDEKKYELPRRYNANNKITRFYRKVYLSEEQFSNLKSFEILKEKMFSDGLIVNVIREHLDSKQIENNLSKINDKTVIVKYPNKEIDSYFKDMLTRYVSLKEILLKGGNDEIITNELSLLMEETVEDIRELIDKYYDNECCYYAVGMENNQKFNDLLSTKFEKEYYKTVIFNNELVNKNNVSSQYQKAVNHIGDLLLSNSIESVKELYSETSPEMTVYTSIVKTLDGDKLAKEIIEGIKAEIISTEETKKIFAEIFEKYYSAPYGLRKGIMPLLVCYAIGELSDNVTLYQQKHEVELNASNIAKAVNSNTNYYIGFAKGSGEQNKFVYDLMNTLKLDASNNFRKDVKSLCDGLRKFFIGLPLIIRSGNVIELDIPETIGSYCHLFMTYDINPTDTVLLKPVNIFGDYTTANSMLCDFIVNWNNYLHLFEENLVTLVKTELSISKDTNLKMGIGAHLKQIVGDSTPILLDSDRTIMDCLNKLSFDDISAIDDISKSVLGIYVEDWNSNREQELLTLLKLFVSNVTKSGKINTKETPLNNILDNMDNVEQTQMGKLLENGVESVFEEYGEAVSNEEKIAILSKLMKKLM